MVFPRRKPGFQDEKTARDFLVRLDLKTGYPEGFRKSGVSFYLSRKCYYLFKGYALWFLCVSRPWFLYCNSNLIDFAELLIFRGARCIVWKLSLSLATVQPGHRKTSAFNIYGPKITPLFKIKFSWFRSVDAGTWSTRRCHRMNPPPARQSSPNKQGRHHSATSPSNIAQRERFFLHGRSDPHVGVCGVGIKKNENASPWDHSDDLDPDGFRCKDDIIILHYSSLMMLEHR